MAWVKLGRVFAPAGEQDWALEYASFPTVERLPDGNLRVYYTSLNSQRYGSTGFVDVDGSNPLRIIRRSEAPVLTYGQMGRFDECGANAFSVVNAGSRRFMYYQGWQLTTRAPYLIFTGLAVSAGADGPFIKQGNVPLLDRTGEEPYMRAAPFVLKEDTRYRMWYVACTEWKMRAGVPQYFVEIRTAVSEDGLRWGASTVCLSPEHHEYAVGRPCVVRSGDIYSMWFSIRSNAEPYRIAYAESRDGHHWSRIDDEAHVVKRSTSGWDSEMVCYPFVVERDGRRLLFYNGNRHGASGFGVAEWR
jgi:predicted GH43/DUF377 family glycosyl hydrolase